MANIKIIEKGCRGCTMCVDLCPVDVFDFDETQKLASPVHTEDCIGCLSCAYACPSQCIEIADVPLVRPFHRIEANVAFVEQFLQTPTAVHTLTGDELDHAYNEVGILLSAFAAAVTEVLGRGHKSVGRRAGTVAAAHLPEMYEPKQLDDLLQRMHQRLGASFDFQYNLAADQAIELRVAPCGLLQAVENAGETPGDSNLCLLFHEYWAGLISAFTGTKYGYDLRQAGPTCRLTFQNQAKL